MVDIATKPKCKRRNGKILKLLMLEYLNQHSRAKKTWLLNASGLNSKNFEKHFKFLKNTKCVEIDSDFLVLTMWGKTLLDELRLNYSDSISVQSVSRNIGVSNVLEKRRPKHKDEFYEHLQYLEQERKKSEELQKKQADRWLSIETKTPTSSADKWLSVERKKPISLESPWNLGDS